jgi:hypothetical protein
MSADRQRRKTFGTLLALACIVATSILRADTWFPPPASRTVVSIDGSAKVVEFSSGEHMQRVIKVYTRSETGSEALSWQAELVNCPVQVFVSPGGDAVVTMDSWGSVGSQALVFYGSRGVLKRYETAQGDLITEREALKVPRSVSSFLWSQGAHAEFTADGSYFWLWLAWGRLLVFDAKTGSAVDSESLRRDFQRGRPTVLRTAERMAESETPTKRIAAARLAGWLGDLPLLTKLLADPYHEDTGQQTQAEDPWGRFAASSPFLLLRRVYPVRRAAAEEIHITFGQAHFGAIEELVAL